MCGWDQLASQVSQDERERGTDHRMVLVLIVRSRFRRHIGQVPLTGSK